MIRHPFETARIRNILTAPQPSPTFPHTQGSVLAGPVPDREQPKDEGSRYFDEMQRIDQDGPGMQKYREALSQMPTREENKPGAFTRIAAALSGFGAGMRSPGAGIETAQAINEHGYDNAMSDYAKRLGTLKESAGMEQDDKDTKLKMLQQARAMGLAYDQYQLKKLESEAKRDTDASQAQTARMRAEAYAQAQSRPGYDSIPQQDGSVLFVNKSNPADRQVVPAQTVAAGQLGVARTNARTGQLNARTAQGELENNVRRTNISETQGADASRRGWAGLSIRNAQGGQGVTPTQQRGASLAVLREMMGDEAFKHFISLDESGTPQMIADDGSEDYQDFLEALNAKIAQRGGR